MLSGIGTRRTSARIPLKIGDTAAFAPPPEHLAAYTPAWHPSPAASARLSRLAPPKGGIKALKRARFPAALAGCRPPQQGVLRPRRAEGKKHNAALTCLARRRAGVTYAKLHDKHPYQPTRKPTARTA
ncbi:hypothetical protein GCM10009735_81780 [Actinomadura chokoriensis]